DSTAHRHANVYPVANGNAGDCPHATAAATPTVARSAFIPAARAWAGSRGGAVDRACAGDFGVYLLVLGMAWYGRTQSSGSCLCAVGTLRLAHRHSRKA